MTKLYTKGKINPNQAEGRKEWKEPKLVKLQHKTTRGKKKRNKGLLLWRP